jgi:hypothetical protein
MLEPQPIELSLLDPYAQPTEYRLLMGRVRGPHCFAQVSRSGQETTSAVHFSLTALEELVALEIGGQHRFGELTLERDEFTYQVSFVLKTGERRVLQVKVGDIAKAVESILGRARESA